MEMENILVEFDKALKSGKSLNKKPTHFLKIWKQLDEETQLAFSVEISRLLQERSDNEDRLDDILTLWVTVLAVNKEWNTLRLFVDSVVEKSSDVDHFREIAIVLLEIAENDSEMAAARTPLEETALVCLTEMGLKLANSENKVLMNKNDCERVVDYITTNLLARSNVNSTALRVSLIHYLTHCPINKQKSQQISRVINRFGQSLLDDVLNGCFANKKKSNASFYFLVDHLNTFFLASPQLAEMAATVLKHYLLKYPTEFPGFLSAYLAKVEVNEDNLRLGMTHTTMLLVEALDIGQKKLTEQLYQILKQQSNRCREYSLELGVFELKRSLNLMPDMKNLGVKKSRNSELLKEIRMNLDKMLNGMLPKSQQELKNQPFSIRRSRSRGSRMTPVKPAKVGDAPTPLEALIQLAS